MPDLTPSPAACIDRLACFKPAGPAFIIDADKLRANAAVLERIQSRTGAKILLALKAFSAWAAFPLLSRAFSGPLWGCCASSVHEAMLAKEFGGEVHAFAAAWSEAEMRQLCGLADHIVFNSLAQLRQFRPLIEAANAAGRSARAIEIGLRLNPEHSEGAAAIYNPCSPGSRLGIRQKELMQAGDADLRNVSGLHFHTLCEQGADALARTLEAFEARFARFITGRQWLNFGGGHHITKRGYDLDLLCALLGSWKSRHGAQIYLEPGEAVALDAGWLVAEALDVVEADMPIAILNASAACHMPDVLEMPYTPRAWLLGAGGPLPALAPGEGGWRCRLAGNSCLAGDVIGEYSFPRPLRRGDRLAFADMAIYSMVKTNTFNGLNLPAIAIHDSQNAQPIKIIKEFGYADFRGRLS